MYKGNKHNQLSASCKQLSPVVTSMVTLWNRTPCGRRVLLSFQRIERLTIFVIVAFEPVRDLS